MVPIWSSASVNGLPLTGLPQMSNGLQTKLFERTRGSGAEVISKKGGAVWAVAISIREVIHAIFWINSVFWSLRSNRELMVLKTFAIASRLLLAARECLNRLKSLFGLVKSWDCKIRLALYRKLFRKSNKTLCLNPWIQSLEKFAKTVHLKLSL